MYINYYILLGNYHMYMISSFTDNVSIAHCRNKKMRTRKSITLLLFRMSCECAKKLNFLSRIYGYTLLFSLAACNIGNALGECAIILSGILCNTYPTYPQTSSTSFHIAPLISYSFFLLLLRRILYPRS